MTPMGAEHAMHWHGEFVLDGTRFTVTAKHETEPKRRWRQGVVESHIDYAWIIRGPHREIGTMTQFENGAFRVQGLAEDKGTPILDAAAKLVTRLLPHLGSRPV